MGVRALADSPHRKASHAATWSIEARAYDDGKIYYNTLDNHTVAVDAKTVRKYGKPRVGDINKGESMTMAPLVVKGKVLVGNSGGEFGVRGWLTALDAKNRENSLASLHRWARQRCLDRPPF